MATAEVGRMSVRGFPDTKGFAQSLKAQLAKIEKQAKVTIEAVLDNSKVVTQAKAAAKAASGVAEVVVSTRIEAAKLARQAVDAAKDASHAATVQIPVELQRGGEFRAQIAEMVAEVQRRSAELRIQADASAARAEADRLAQQIANQQPQMQVGLDTALAATHIAVLTRDRFATIHARVSASSLAASAAALAGLSGSRVLSGFGRGVRSMVENMDRAVPSVALMATTLTNLVSVAGAGVGSLLGIAGGIVQIGAAVAVLPAMFAAGAIGVGVLIAALKDTGEVLGDLAPQFSALQDSISASFWAQAAPAIRTMVAALMPLMGNALPWIAEDLGNIAASIANAVTQAQGMGVFTELTHQMLMSGQSMADAFGSLTSGLLTFVGAGAKYLPQMAQWFAQITRQFQEFAKASVASGAFDSWVQSAWQNLKALGGVISGVVGILGGLSRAASAAGGASLGALAAGLQSVSQAINGPVWQGALTTVFAGMNQAVSALGPGVSALGNAFLVMAPVLAQIMVLAGQAGSALLTGLGSVLSSPMLLSGATMLFTGIRDGLTSLAAAGPQVGTALGAVLGVMGTLATHLGPLLATAITALTPAFTQMLSALQPIIPVLSGALISALQILGPILATVATAVSGFAHQFPGLAAGIAVAAGGVGALIPIVVSVLSTLGAVIPVITALVGAFSAGGAAAGLLGGVMGGLGTALSVITGPIGLIAAAFALAVATSAPLRAALMTLGQTLISLGATLMGAILPVLQQLAGAILPVLGSIFAAIVPVITTVVQIFTQLATMLVGLLMPVIQALLPVVMTVFTAIGSIITAAVGVIQAILTTFLALLQGNWAGVWAGLGTIVQAAWALIQAVVGGALAILWSVIQAGLTLIQTIWSGIWSVIGGVVSGIWAGITAAVSAGIAWVQNVIAVGMAAVRAVWNTIWSALSGPVSAIWNVVQTVVQVGISIVRTLIAAGMAAVQGNWSQAWSLVQRAASMAWNLIQSLVQVGINAVRSVIASVMAGIQALWSAAWSGIQSAASSAWETIKSTISTAVSNMLSAIRDGASNAVSAMRDMGSNIVSAVSGFVGDMVSAGGDIVRGLIDGIKGMAGAAVEAAKGVVKGALDGAKALLGINSPSREFRKVGRWSVEGYVVGIESAAHLAVKAAKKMASDTVKAASGTKGSVTAAARSVSGIWAEFVNSPSTTKAAGQRDWAKKVMPKMAAAMKGQWGRIGTTAGSELAKGLQGSVGQVAKTAKDMQAAITKQLDMNARGSKVPGHYERSKANGYDYYGIHYKKMVDSAASALKRLAATEAQLKTKLTGLGGNASQGMAAGIRNQIKSVQDQAKRLAATLVATVRTQLDINSPSRVMAQLGAYAGRGFTVGLDHEAAAAQSAMAALVAAPRPVTPQAPATGAGEGEDPNGVSMLEVLMRILAAIEAGKEMDGVQLLKGLQSTQRSHRMPRTI